MTSINIPPSLTVSHFCLEDRPKFTTVVDIPFETWSPREVTLHRFPDGKWEGSCPACKITFWWQRD